MRRRRNKYLPVIGVLAAFLILYIIITLVKNLRVFIVFSSGVGPFLFVGAIILVMVVLYVRGSRTY
ncbi:hypothetical protein M3182_14490 [Mesobacillus maritimus]|uniref:hypothetical protein n=1 Tax=Mesobacillus maritimus TaxID=1643336 RepID=UPI00203FC76B|nr:hypothetical protein [Mesobacillus maritimus]MCM3586944.1 hypothetical protein [Mesobacillus maritimus]MCM3670866.1 hypothetical protein [Mesobacillus maritimus]